VLRPRILKVQTTFPYNVEILSGVHNLLFVLGKKDRDHFFFVGKTIAPIFVIEVFLKILFVTGFVLFHNEFIEGILENSLKYPFAKNLKVWLRTLFKEKFE
jgi:hypothetical protein